MPVIQEAFYIPPDIATGLATGLYRRLGGVVRYAIGPNKGQIVKHLDPVDIPKADEAAGLLAKAVQFAKNNKKVTLIGGAVVVVVGGGTALYFGIKNHEPAVVKEFKKALAEYVEAIRNGEMDLETIETFMTALETMRQHKNFDKFSIKLSAEDIDVLVGRIYEYTIKLAEDNEYVWEAKEIDNSESPILNLQKYLEVQREIFSSAA